MKDYITNSCCKRQTFSLIRHLANWTFNSHVLRVPINDLQSRLQKRDKQIDICWRRTDGWCGKVGHSIDEWTPFQTGLVYLILTAACIDRLAHKASTEQRDATRASFHFLIERTSHNDSRQVVHTYGTCLFSFYVSAT